VTPSLALPRAWGQGSEKKSQRAERRYWISPHPSSFPSGSHSSKFSQVGYTGNRQTFLRYDDGNP